MSEPKTPPSQVMEPPPKDLLTATLKRPMDKAAMANDNATLGSLLGMLNNPAITGAQVPPEERAKTGPRRTAKLAKQPASAGPAALNEAVVFAAVMGPPDEAVTQPPDSPAPVAQAATTERVASPIRKAGSKLFFTGRVAAGKDYCATQAGAHILGLADPLYAMVGHLFNLPVTATTGKDTPGVREMLQTLGQWGRNVINRKYPVTPARALFGHYVRTVLGSEMPPELMVDWAGFGRNPDIWLDSAILRAEEFVKNNPDRRVAITNVRFENEFKRLTAEGWTGYHIMCGTATWQERLKAQGIEPGNPVLTDTSEDLAAFLDRDVAKKIHTPNPGGGMLRVIWNDKAPPPSKRLYTLNQWLQEIAMTEVLEDPAQAMARE